jgi:hypothetical protein
MAGAPVMMQPHGQGVVGEQVTAASLANAVQ